MSEWQAVLPGQPLRPGAPRGAAARAGAGAAVALVLVRAPALLRACLNRCPHRGVNLDWIPARFFDTDGKQLQYSTRGAPFEPASGPCVACPCVGATLTAPCPSANARP